MHLKCRCPHCGTKIRYQVELSSGFAHCPGCKTQFQLPDAPPGMVRGAGGALSPGVRPAAASPSNLVPPSRGGLGLALRDPMNAQPEAMKAMGRESLLTWGFLMGMAFPILGWLAFWRGTNVFSGQVFGGLLRGSVSGEPGNSGSAKVADHIAVVAEISVFAFLLLSALQVLNILHGRQTPMRGVLFTTGLTLLPFAGLSLYFVVLSFLEIKSSEVADALTHLTMFLTLLTLSSFFLLLFSSITSVLGFSHKAAFWLIPGILMVIFVLFTWITKLTGEISKMGGKKAAYLSVERGLLVGFDGELQPRLGSPVLELEWRREAR